MATVKAILIGFFPKKTARDVPWLGASHVEEICSVSNCVSKPPTDWIGHWKHNMTWWLYDSEADAWEVTGAEREAYDMYAYKMFPVVFEGAGEHPIEVTATAKGGLTDYEFIGYDAVHGIGPKQVKPITFFSSVSAKIKKYPLLSPYARRSSTSSAPTSIS